MDEVLVPIEQPRWREADHKAAVERVVSFSQRFGEAHLTLAFHAALPLALTPDLLYRIWANFVPRAPWTAISDVLLSPLCREVGYELYEMDVAVRNLLLRELREDERFGQQRLNELADFLMEYVDQRLDSDDPDGSDLAGALRLTALAYTRPGEAARTIRAAASELLSEYEREQKYESDAELTRMESLVETLALEEMYDISISEDWETSPASLRSLREGIVDLANAMGGTDQFTRKIGRVTISRAEMKYRALASARGVKFTASPIGIDPWTAVHDLAHVWDINSGWRLSKALETYTGGRTNWLAALFKRLSGGCDEQRRLPGCNRFGYFYGGVPPAGSDQNFNRREDFAESVTAYVYPEMAQMRVERFKDDGRYKEFLYYSDYTQTPRWAFVDGLIKGTIVV